ncbi:MAG: hypothetical protein JEZ05_09050 [Tenericutes bacterium]|nr:hypothetical protein [Mycoplasmatota bacterium]
MKQSLESFILNLEPGKVYEIDEIINLFDSNTLSRNYVTVTLSKLYKDNKIAKTINGKYYIQVDGLIAPLPVSKENDIIQRYITDGNLVYGVFSGYRILNKWGLSQQYAVQKKVITNNINIHNYYMKKLNVKLKKSKFEINKNNYQIAEFFEVLKSYANKNVNENIENMEYQIAMYVNKNFSDREKIEVVYYLYNFESSITVNKFMKVFEYLDKLIHNINDMYWRDEIETT